MTYSIILFVTTLLLLGAYTFFSLRRDGWRSYVGPIGFGIVTLSLVVGFGNTLGSCVPEWMEWDDKMDVLAIVYDEPVAVYIWGMQSNKPACVMIPWNEERAKKMRKTEGEGGSLEYVWGTGPETEGSLHPKPQEPLPPKDISE